MTNVTYIKRYATHALRQFKFFFSLKKGKELFILFGFDNKFPALVEYKCLWVLLKSFRLPQWLRA